jgi:hypothetical protein
MQRRTDYKTWTHAEQERLELGYLASFWIPPDAGQPSPNLSELDLGRFRTKWRACAVLIKAEQPRMLILDAFPELPERLLRLVDPDNTGQQVTLSTLSASEILTTDWPEPTWAIPQLLPVGMAFLAGKPKVGKSWLALQIACAVATGGMVLNQRVEPGPLLYLALEDTPRRLQDRMRKLGWPSSAAGDAEFQTLGTFQDEIGNLAQTEGVARLAAQMRARKYRLVVIDTLSRAVRGDQNDANIMTSALSPLQAVALEMNCVLLVIDHHRKSSGAASDPILDVGGSVAKSGTADCLWGLYKEQGKAGAVLHILGRDVDEIRLKLMADPVTRCWQCEGDADHLLTHAEQEILDVAEELGRFQLMDVIVTLGRDRAEKGNIHNRLQDLGNKGYLLRTNEGRKVYYEVIDPLEDI